MRKFYYIAVFTSFLLLAGCGSKPRPVRYPALPKGPASVSGIVEDVEFLQPSNSYYYQPITVTFKDGRVGSFTLWINSGPFVFAKGKRNTIIMNSNGYVVRVEQDG